MEGPQALGDIISIITRASRMGRGNLVWLTWVAGTGDQDRQPQSRIKSGSTAIAVSKRGAAKLKAAFADGSFPHASGHWDLDLKSWLVKEQELVQACYLCPPMGNHWAHTSGCDHKAGWVRPSSWGANWCCQGTRQSEDPRGREKWLCGWTSNGNTTWLRAIPADPTTDWHTFWDIDENNPWLSSESHPPRDGPDQSHPPGAAPASSSEARSSAASSRDPAPHTTRRRKRQEHQVNTLCRFRYWVTDIAEARAWWKEDGGWRWGAAHELPWSSEKPASNPGPSISTRCPPARRP
jgi:hypothetical protein